MNYFLKVSPLRILDKSLSKSLGRGNLGVLMARAGVGKTACLVHIAFDKLFRNEKLIHVALEDMPEKVTSYYDVIFSDLIKVLEKEDDSSHRMILERNRMILSYMKHSFEISRLRENLNNLIDKVAFRPDAIIVDGLDFENTERSVFEGFQELASEFQVEIWFSALTHRHNKEVSERGIPYPCSTVDDLMSIIVQLEPDQSGVFIKMLKDHDFEVRPDASVRLDPNTFLVTE